MKYSEKDRIIENSIFSISFEIIVGIENELIVFWRYVEAIQKMISEENVNFAYKEILTIRERKIIIRIIT